MAERIVGGKERRIQKARMRENGWTPHARKKFLDTLASSCNVRLASEAADIARTNAYKLRKRDPEFAALWREALTIGYLRLEEALLSHALSALNAIEIEPGELILGTAAAYFHDRSAGAEEGEDAGPGEDQSWEGDAPDGADAKGDGSESGDAAAAGQDEPLPGSARVPGSGIDSRFGTADLQLALALLNRHRGTVEGRGRPAMTRRATPEETDQALRSKLDGVARRLALMPARGPSGDKAGEDTGEGARTEAGAGDIVSGGEAAGGVDGGR
jgi:hypothetical protein